MAGAENDSKSGAIELSETHTGPGPADIDLQSEDDFNAADSRMSFAKWMACFALGLSYTTAIQQHSCTATIVKHIDIALGNINNGNGRWSLTMFRAYNVLQLDNKRSQCHCQSDSTTRRRTFGHLRAPLFLSRGLLLFTHWDDRGSGGDLNQDDHRRHGAERNGQRGPAVGVRWSNAPDIADRTGCRRSLKLCRTSIAEPLRLRSISLVCHGLSSVPS
jgi:hypothetical protein